MRRQIAGNRNEDVPALVRVTPYGGLADSRLQHLVGVEAGVLAQHRKRQGGDRRLRRMADREVTMHPRPKQTSARMSRF
jgi:hypothetical protein